MEKIKNSGNMFDRLKTAMGPFAGLDFNKLFGAQLLSHYADAFAMFLLGALLVSLSENVGKSIAITFFAFLLPQVLFAPFAGAICDKFSRKAILVLSCLLRFAVALCLIFALNSLNHNGIYACAFVIGSGAAFFYPAKMSANVVENKQQKFANAFLSTTGAAALLLGALGSNCLAMFGLKNAFCVVCGMYFLAALLCAIIKFKTSEMQAAALNYLQTHARIFYILGLAVFVQFVAGAFLNSFNAMICDFYGLAFLDLTILRTVLGIGIVAGVLAFVFFARFVKVQKLCSAAFLVLCLIFLTAVLCQNTAAAQIWLFAAGISYAILITALDTIVQKISPDGLRAKVFGVILSVNALSFLAGTVLVSTAVGFINPVDVFKSVSLGAFLLFAGLIAFDHSFRKLLGNSMKRK